MGLYGAFDWLITWESTTVIFPDLQILCHHPDESATLEIFYHQCAQILWGQMSWQMTLKNVLQTSVNLLKQVCWFWKFLHVHSTLHMFLKSSIQPIFRVCILEELWPCYTGDNYVIFGLVHLLYILKNITLKHSVVLLDFSRVYLLFILLWTEITIGWTSLWVTGAVVLELLGHSDITTFPSSHFGLFGDWLSGVTHSQYIVQYYTPEHWVLVYKRWLPSSSSSVLLLLATIPELWARGCVQLHCIAFASIFNSSTLNRTSHLCRIPEIACCSFLSLNQCGSCGCLMLSRP